PFDRTRPSDSDLTWLTNLVDVYEVDLGGSGVTGSCLADVPAASLFVLQLWGSQVTDTSLATVERFTKLRFLSLADTSVSDKGLAHLASLNNLELLDLGGTRISGA